LKSNSANFGAIRLSKQAKVLEDFGKSGSLDQAGTHLEDAEAEYSEVKIALERIQNNG
jgi:HPt (histidine-containing phosphotransfer) domain-containing protein